MFEIRNDLCHKNARFWVTSGKYEEHLAEMKKLMWECKPFKHLDPDTRKRRRRYIDGLVRRDSVAGIWKIRADKGENRNGSGNSPVAGSKDGEVDVRVAGTEKSAPGGGHLDWDEPLHVDSDLEESYRRLFK